MANFRGFGDQFSAEKLTLYPHGCTYEMDPMAPFHAQNPSK